MCFAFLSAPIGAIVGLVVLVVTGTTAFPAVLGAAIAGAVVGWVSGLFLAQESLRHTLPIRRYRHHAEEVALAFAVVGPPIVALAVTILAGMNFQTT